MRKFIRTLWLILTFPFRLIGWIVRLLFNSLRQSVQAIYKFLTEEPDDSPVADTIQKAVENPMDILTHLDALRKHLFRAIVVLAIATVFAFAYAGQIIDLLAVPVGGIGELTSLEPTESLGAFMRVSMLIGITLSAPYIFLELLLFAGPGLSRRARLTGLFSIPIVYLFFVGGMVFAYYAMLGPALDFLLNFSGIEIINKTTPYMNFATGLIFWTGISFEYPLVIYALAAMGLIKARLLIDHWRIAVVILTIFAAAITPTIDPVTMSLVLGPLLVLYAFSILLASLAQRRRSKRDR